MLCDAIDEFQDERALWSTRMDWAQYAMWTATIMIGLLTPGGILLAKTASSLPASIAYVLWIGSIVWWAWTTFMFIRTSSKAKKAAEASIDWMVGVAEALQVGKPPPPIPAIVLGTHEGLGEVEENKGDISEDA